MYFEFMSFPARAFPYSRYAGLSTRRAEHTTRPTSLGARVGNEVPSAKRLLEAEVRPETKTDDAWTGE
jgi:hypothetical protein